jgi:hypothetical protein
MGSDGRDPSVVTQAGFEPATYSSGGCRSNPLSYWALSVPPVRRPEEIQKEMVGAAGFEPATSTV